VKVFKDFVNLQSRIGELTNSGKEALQRQDLANPNATIRKLRLWVTAGGGERMSIVNFKTIVTSGFDEDALTTATADLGHNDQLVLAHVLIGTLTAGDFLGRVIVLPLLGRTDEAIE